MQENASCGLVTIEPLIVSGQHEFHIMELEGMILLCDLISFVHSPLECLDSLVQSVGDPMPILAKLPVLFPF